jgi:hypothetical protein
LLDVPDIAVEFDGADMVAVVSCWCLNLAAVLRHKTLMGIFGTSVIDKSYPTLCHVRTRLVLGSYLGIQQCSGDSLTRSVTPYEHCSVVHAASVINLFCTVRQHGTRGVKVTGIMPVVRSAHMVCLLRKSLALSAKPSSEW